MKCVILVAGHGDSLEAEVLADDSGRYSHLEGVPKALMPAGAQPGGGAGSRRRILDCWWDLIKGRRNFSEVRTVRLGQTVEVMDFCFVPL